VQGENRVGWTLGSFGERGASWERVGGGSSHALAQINPHQALQQVRNVHRSSFLGSVSWGPREWGCRGEAWWGGPLVFWGGGGQ
jgi:hypothetical protein